MVTNNFSPVVMTGEIFILLTSRRGCQHIQGYRMHRHPSLCSRSRYSRHAVATAPPTRHFPQEQDDDFPLSNDRKSPQLHYLFLVYLGDL